MPGSGVGTGDPIAVRACYPCVVETWVLRMGAINQQTKKGGIMRLGGSIDLTPVADMLGALTDKLTKP